MALIVCSIVVALVVARLAGGQLSSVERLPAHGLLLLAAAMALLAVGLIVGWLGLPAGPCYAVALGLSGVLVGRFMLVNRSLTGTGLIAAGLLLNAMVVGLNAAMPVSAHAAARAGVGVAAVGDRWHTVAGSHTRLRPLGEVIAVPLPLWPEVDSLGDLLVAAGLAQLVFMALRPPPYGRRKVGAGGPEPTSSKILTHTD
ncbi:MAG: DUF5317 family protein [Pseudonocardiales bacterium]